MACMGFFGLGSMPLGREGPPSPPPPSPTLPPPPPPKIASSSCARPAALAGSSYTAPFADLSETVPPLLPPAPEPEAATAPEPEAMTALAGPEPEAMEAAAAETKAVRADTGGSKCIVVIAPAAIARC